MNESTTFTSSSTISSTAAPTTLLMMMMMNNITPTITTILSSTMLPPSSPPQLLPYSQGAVSDEGGGGGIVSGGRYYNTIQHHYGGNIITSSSLDNYSNNNYSSSFHGFIDNNNNNIMNYNYNNINSWNRVFKLILLTFASILGTMGSIFLISSITVIDAFQVRGNCYLVSLAFGHLLVNVLVLPASIIAIMANWNDGDQIMDDICHFQWILTLACFFVSALSFLFLSMDNYYCINTKHRYQNCCTRCRIFLMVAIIWSTAASLTGVQYKQNWGPEFCTNRRHWPISLDYHPYVLGLFNC